MAELGGDHRDVEREAETPDRADGAGARRIGRRALVKAGIALVPVIVTVRSQPADATHIRNSRLDSRAHGGGSG